jgi:hypothetical protein
MEAMAASPIARHESKIGELVGAIGVAQQAGPMMTGMLNRTQSRQRCSPAPDDSAKQDEQARAPPPI